uniref:dihydrofolate reductase family protein n=1 Tax=Janibacter melonis TaxID=262209 RepID=UPI0020965231
AALRAGLVDEVSAYVGPRVAGAGSRRFVPEGLPLELRLRETEPLPGGARRPARTDRPPSRRPRRAGRRTP